MDEEGGNSALGYSVEHRDQAIEKGDGGCVRGEGEGQ